MKNIFICVAGILVMTFFAGIASFADDFVLEYTNEYYKETYVDNGNELKIYHTLQVKTPFGPKLLVLAGNDVEYRNWLREYLSYQTTLLATVPDNETMKFMKSKVFYIDVNRLHSVADGKWRSPAAEAVLEPWSGAIHILLVDDDVERVNLVKRVIEHLGYSVTARSSGKDAFKTFAAQPDKYGMLISDYSMSPMNGAALARKIMDINPDIPIVICTEYGEAVTDDMMAEASLSGGRYVVKEVMLRDVGRTIRNILGDRS